MKNFDVSDLIGKPFAEDSTGPDAYDCWGLVTEVARRAGISFPDINRPVGLEKWDDLCDEFLGRDFRRIERPEPFAIVAIKLAIHWHAGIVLPDTFHFVHVTDGHRVNIQSVGSRLWTPFIEGFYRYVHGDVHTQPV